MSTSPWAALLPAALAGTRRQPLAPLPGLTPTLGSEAAAPEKELLLTAANAALVQRAGRRPLPGPADSLGRAPAEVMPTLAPAVVALLRQPGADRALDKVGGQCRHLLRPWRLSHQALGQYLRQEPGRRHYQLLAYSTLGGNRGEWLLAWHPESFVRDTRHSPRYDNWWLPEPGMQRDSHLWQLTWQRPPGGWEWLLREWQAGTPEQRLALAGVLTRWARTEPLPAAFEPLVMELAAAAPPDAYPADLLACLPASPRLEHYWVAAQELLSWQPGAAHLTVTLPDLTAARWQSYRATSAVLPPYVLSGILGWTRPSRWAAAWNLTAPEVVALLLTSEHAEILLLAWKQAAHRFRDLEAIRALLALTRTGQAHLRNSDDAVAYIELASQLPTAELVAWRLQWLPPLPLTAPPVPDPRQPADWLTWAGDGSGRSGLFPTELKLALITFMQAYFALPPEAPGSYFNRSMEDRLANLLERYGASPQLADAVEAQLLPLARAQPQRPLGKTVLAIWPALAFYRELAASLPAPPLA